MAVSRAEVDAAPEVTSEQIMTALGSNDAIIRTNADAIRVAEHVRAEVFKVGGTVYIPYDTKLD